MIHAFNFCGKRDKDLGRLMETTLKRHAGRYLASFTSTDMDSSGYGNGAGWESSMMKLDALRTVCKKVKDDDWVLSIDSDVVFCKPYVFDFLKLADSFKYNHYGITGIHHVPPLANCALGELHNFSGCSIYIRGRFAKHISALPESELNEVRAEFKEYVITENEDIVLSYLVQRAGGAALPFPEDLFHSNKGFEEDILSGDLKSFYHLNYDYSFFKGGLFLGVPISGKWDIPIALRKRKIAL